MFRCMSLIRKSAPVLIFLAAFALYLTTLAPGMLRGDSGEFQWAMASLNVAHATGYPFFTLIGYFWQLVPLTPNVAWQLNLLAPLFAAMAVATLFVFIRSVTRSTAAALIGALFFALAPVMWFNASILEVYPLHAFLLALTFYLLWRWSRAPEQNARAQNALLYFAFFVLGLAFAHHRLIMLALPAIAYFLLATDHRFLLNFRRMLFCALLVLPGLLLYVYVPLRLLPSGFSFDYAFTDIILGREYAGSLLQHINPLPVLVEIPLRNFQAGLVLALVGVITLFRRAPHLNIALLLVYLVDVAFALVYSVPDVEVFLTSSFVVTAIWIGAGAAFLIEWLATRVGVKNARLIQIPLTVLFIILPLIGLIHFPEIQTAVANEAAPEPRARAIAISPLIPIGSLLEIDWETATALRFLQATEHLRPDLEARLIGLDKRDEYWLSLANVDAGRPVFTEKGVTWTRAPAGYSSQTISNDLAQITYTAPDMTRAQGVVSDKIELVGYRSTRDALTLYWRVKQPLQKDFATYIHYLDADGNKLAQDDRAACCQAVYSYRTSDWEAGRIYADVFKPLPPNTDSLLIGMYEDAGGDINQYGDEITLKP